MVDLATSAKCSLRPADATSLLHCEDSLQAHAEDNFLQIGWDQLTLTGTGARRGPACQWKNERRMIQDKH
jgi:hypothetical protein